MANENAKQKAIIEAYGEHYETLKNEINQHGVFVGDTEMISDELFNKWSFIAATEPVNTLGIKKVSGSRPKSLSGIENNNGWIRIESGNDLPKEEGQYFVYSKVDWHPYFRIDVFSGRLSNSIHHVTGKPIFSHYQPIQKPKPPIY